MNHPNISKVFVYYTYIPDLNLLLPAELLQLLPVQLQHEIELYQKQDDKVRLLAGKLLLRHAINQLSFHSDLFYQYQIDKRGRPFINQFFDFNITHSGHIVACAVINQGRVGIDVEMVRSIEPQKFTKQFSPPEMDQILKSTNPQLTFFEFWTKKEAVMKADGRGMRIPLHSIQINDMKGIIDGTETIWFLESLNFDSNHISNICSNQKFQIEILENVQLFLE